MQSHKAAEGSGPSSMSKIMHFVMFGYDRFDAPTNMAIDEILKRRSEETGSIFIRFYSFTKPSIILSLSDSIKCIKSEGLAETENVDVTRRQSGGKPIYVDENVLAYSITGSESIDSTRDFVSLESIHKYFGSRVAKAISHYSNSSSVEIGDVYSIKAEGKPLAGHAQYLTPGKSFFYHGVIAMRAWDSEKINKLLRMRPGDYEELKVLPSLESISSLKPGSYNLENSKSSLVREILAQVSGNDYEEITKEEKQHILDLAVSLVSKKYRNRDWIEKSNGGTLREDSAFCLLYTG